MGTNASSIAKRKPLGEPVLEKHLFVPNRATLTTEQAIRVNVQIALENEYKLKVKVVELIDEETRENDEPLSPLISDALGDLPLVKAEITVLSSKVGEVRDAVVEDKKLPTETGCFVVVASNIFSRIQVRELNNIAFYNTKANLSFYFQTFSTDFSLRSLGRSP